MESGGGSTKRFVWDNVRSRKHIVNSAVTFVAAASEMPKVRVDEMDSSTITARNNTLDLDNVFEKAVSVKGIASMHCIELIDGKVVASITTEDALEADEDHEVDDDVDMASIDGVAPRESDVPSVTSANESNNQSDISHHDHMPSDNNNLKQSDNNSVNNNIEIHVHVHVGSWFLVVYDGD